MGDTYVEAYKKAVEKAQDRWSRKVRPVNKRLTEIQPELQKLEEIKKPSDDDKKKIAALTKERKECKKAIEEASEELKVELMKLELDAKAKEKEALKLPKWLEGVVKKGGVPLTDNLTFKPDASFDFKEMKLKSFSVGLKWEF